MLTNTQQGIAFAEYIEPSVANEPAIKSLNGMDVGGQTLRVTKASIGPTQVANFDVGITAISGLASQTSNEIERSSVIQLLNMVTPEELMDNEDYEGTLLHSPLLSVSMAVSLNGIVEICEDVHGECIKYGEVVELKVPRPSGGSRQSAGVGKIYVKFDSKESATKALTALAGRKFADRTVVTTYFSEVRQGFLLHAILLQASNIVLTMLPQENFEVNAW